MLNLLVFFHLHSEVHENGDHNDDANGDPDQNSDDEKSRLRLLIMRVLRDLDYLIQNLSLIIV